MIKYTYDEYDKMTEIFDKVSSSKKMPVYWPAPEEIDKFYNDPPKYIKYACYLYENNPSPCTEDERESRKRLGAFINSNMQLTD